MVYGEITKCGLIDEVKSWVTDCCYEATERQFSNGLLLFADVVKVTDHWASLHDKCVEFDPTRKCVVEPRKVKPYFLAGELILV